ncbi:hypothetical protein CcCBS67573_g08521 [Chytriomyces confervae]|uniref:Peptide hydrolase n=1 Tax=Chytriomyces confervae TaxID=246404 RepID=A0A507EIW0_9FUNG|nr:hypothetical protein CcCBS67573_g08521 [Chytriomyces confervae]
MEEQKLPLLGHHRRTHRGSSAFIIWACLFIGLMVAGTFLLRPGRKFDVPADSRNVIKHLTKLEQIAASHGNGSRSITRGFNASFDYVEGFLKNLTDYTVWAESLTVQDQVDYDVPSLSLDSLSLTPNADFMTGTGSGSGAVSNLPLVYVGGCNSAVDTTSQSAPFVALLTQTPPSIDASRPNATNACDLSLCGRIAYAVANLGASAVLVAKQPSAQGYPQPLAPSGRLPKCNPDQASIVASVPVFMLSQAASWEFVVRAIDKNVVHKVSLSAHTRYESIVVKNLLAETKAGDASKIVIYGSHLDSVRAGPGVNDDGSGAMATLELAHAFSRSGLARKTVQKVRFAWWTAEEIGLLGSIHHVQSLTDAAAAAYKLNVDTDMIASPNFVRGVWDGRSVEDDRIRDRCAAIQGVFEGYFARRGLPTVPFRFNGRSDFAPFMSRGIPAGGVITGEDEIKTLEEAELFGGIANMVLDPNYHQPSDTVANLRGPGELILGQNVDALAHSLGFFAFHHDIDGFLAGK